MSSQESPPVYNNWVKSSEGLLECCRGAAVVVKQVMGQWHQSKIQPNHDDLKCAGNPTCNPELKNGIPNKPKAGRGYCKQCIKWGDDVIPELLAKCTVPTKPAYEVYWHHVKSSDFYDSAVQVAKLFGLKAIDRDALAAITDFDLFDCAWLLAIIEKVALFHSGDVQKQAQDTTEIRNTIMHRPVVKKMPDAQMEGYFEAYSKFLLCLKQHFPHVITEKDVEGFQDRLNKIRNMNRVTSDMKNRTVTIFTNELETWKMHGADIQDIKQSLKAVTDICKDVPELEDRLNRVETDLATIRDDPELEDRLNRVETDMATMRGVPELADRLNMVETDLATMRGDPELEDRLSRVETDVATMKGQYSSLIDQKEKQQQKQQQQQQQQHQQQQQQNGDSGYSSSSNSNSTNTSSHTTSGNRSDSKQYSNGGECSHRQSQSYDILLVHCEEDMDDNMYKDLENFLRDKGFSYISMHELPAGVDKFKNFERKLEECSFTICLLTSNFLSDEWCDKRYLQACEYAVRKRSESVLYMKAKGFSDDDIPSGLKGISGVDYGSRFYKNTLRNTFADLPRNQASIPVAVNHQSTTPSSQQQHHGHSIVGETVVQGSNNTVINAGPNSTVIINQMPPKETSSNGSVEQTTPPQPSNNQTSGPSNVQCSDLIPTSENPVGDDPVQCSENPHQESTKINPDDSKPTDATSHQKQPQSELVSSVDPSAEVSIEINTDSMISDTTSHQDPPYNELVSSVDIDAKDQEPTSHGNHVANTLTQLQLLRVKEDTFDSSQIKKSLSSPDLPSLVKDDNEQRSRLDSESSLRSIGRLRSSSEMPLPFVGYSESFKPKYKTKEDDSSPGVTGLKNLGNTCFMNSAIQCLSSATILAQYFIGGEYQGISATDDGNKGKVAKEFAKVMYALWSGQYQRITPSDLYDTVCNQLPMFNDIWEKGRQQDAHEFLLCLIEHGLHKDLNTAEQKSGNSPEPPKLPDEDLSIVLWNQHTSCNRSVIVNLFQGQLRSVVECQECQQKSTTFDIFTFLTLPIPSTKSKLELHDCFQEFSKEEKLEGDNAYYCCNCKKLCNATKRIDIWKLPKILLICFKRFSWEEIGGNLWKKKKETLVEFPVTDLDMSDFTSGTKPSNPYNLFAVANHIGGNIAGGHYTAYCQNAANKKWYDFNDEKVQEISTEEIQTSKAYLLFYSCVDLMPPM